MKFYHLLLNKPKTRHSGLENLWESITEELIDVTVDSGKNNIEELQEFLINTISSKITKKMTLESQKQVLTPFAKALQSIDDLDNPDHSSYTHFQESLQESQKILFELKEMLSLSGVISPVLYDIVKAARELNKTYTSKKELIRDLREKITNWEERLRKNSG